MLIRATQFRCRYFEADARPSMTTVRKWIDDGTVPGRRIGGKYFVDRAAFEAGDDPVVARILRDAASA